MPLFAGLMRMWASVPTGVAMVSACGLLSLWRIPFQAAIMGGRFTLVQVFRRLLLPFLAGALARLMESFL